MITRQEWGAGRLTAYTNSVKPSLRSGITIHHSVTAQGTTKKSVEAILRGIDSFHRSKGWGGIGYNFAVDHRGRVYEARGRDIIGVHASGANTSTFGICYIGNTDKKLTASAIEAIKGLVDSLQNDSKKKLDVKGHRDINSTACPGRLLYREIKAGTFDIRYLKAEFITALPLDTYHKIAVRQLAKTNSNPTRAEKTTERQRIRKLNNGATITAGMKVRVK
jgi:hypothetical protein